MKLLAYTEGTEWKAGIGDPTIMGWFTVLAYVMTALASYRAAREAKGLTSHQPEYRSRRILWTGLACLLAALAINKQLDLQTWFTLTLKRLSIAQGWYEHRRFMQLLFIIFLGAGGLVGLALLWRLVRNHWRESLLPLAGLTLLIVFVLARAASFHYMDQFLGWKLAGIKMNWAMELGAISLVFFGARQAFRRYKQEPKLNGEI